jgi:hypothetical protein
MGRGKREREYVGIHTPQKEDVACEGVRSVFGIGNEFANIEAGDPSTKAAESVLYAIMFD